MDIITLRVLRHDLRDGAWEHLEDRDVSQDWDELVEQVVDRFGEATMPALQIGDDGEEVVIGWVYPDGDEPEHVEIVVIPMLIGGRREVPALLAHHDQRLEFEALAREGRADLTVLEQTSDGPVVVRWCTACGSSNVVPIVYGMPGPELVDAAEAGRVRLGGCVIAEDPPTHGCRRCGQRYREVDGELVAGGAP